MHPNPGLDSVISSIYSSISSVDSIQNLSNLNIQSILPKIDQIRCEAQAYNILVFSESWMKAEITDNDIYIEFFMPPYRTDRVDREGEGFVVCVRDTFSCRRRNDLENCGIEVVWVEVNVKGKTILLVSFYRPPNSTNAYLNMIAESFREHVILELTILSSLRILT